MLRTSWSRLSSKKGPLRVLIYSHFFAPSIGGVESIVQSLATGLARLATPEGRPEFQVVLVTQTSKGSFDDEALPYRVVRRPGRLALIKMIRECDVLHVSGPAVLPLVLANLFRRPVALEHHGFQAVCPNGQLFMESRRAGCPGYFMAGEHLECMKCNSGQGWLVSVRLWFLTFIRRFLASRAQANISPTKWLGSILQLPQIVHIPHGLEARGAPLSGESGLNASPRIVFQGRLVSTKGADILLEAARLLTEHGCPVELVVIGDGPERRRLEAMTRQPSLMGKVRFAGVLAPPELEIQLAAATLVVVPSLGGEVFGLVVAENMLRGLPLVVSDLGAFVEVLGDSGAVFRAGDAQDLSRCLEALLSDPEKQAAMRIAARRRVQEIFPLEQMIHQHAALYRQIIA